MKQNQKRRILVLLAIVLGLIVIKDEQSTKRLSNLLIWSDDDGSTSVTVRKRNITMTVGNTTITTTTIAPDHPIRIPEFPNTTTNNNMSTTTNNNMTTPHMTLIVQLSGELGNQISKIAYGVGLQLMVQELFGYTPPMKFRAQPRPKWRHAMIDTKACFPNVRHYDFQECNTPEFDQLQKEQANYLGKEEASQLELRNIGHNATQVQQALQLAQSIAWKRYHEIEEQQQQQLRNQTTRPTSTSTTTMPLPHIYADNFCLASSFMMDRYYAKFKEFFTFDTSVCKSIPEPDEIVLHIRNFLVEMPRRGKRMGFEELSPHHIATLLLSKVKAGSKIAITSRYANSSPHMDPYVQALESQGFVVRLIQNQNGVQDFCFLMKTQNILIGTARSTYVDWAGVLGNASKVRLYSVDSLATRARLPENANPQPPQPLKRISKFQQPHHNFTTEELKSKFQYEFYPAEDVLNATNTTFETWSDQYL